MNDAADTQDPWFYVAYQRHRPAWNMAFDEALLRLAPKIGSPILRFYGWKEPAGTFGYFQQYSFATEATSLRPLIRRPTGGGVVPHDHDWTYSLTFPRTHPWAGLRATESYQQLHTWIGAALQTKNIQTQLAGSAIVVAPGQCFIGAEKFDLLSEGRKIGGAAQRRTREGLLIQGSIQPPPQDFTIDEWMDAMRKTGRKLWRARWERLQPEPELRALADQLEQEKYCSPEYTNPSTKPHLI